MHIPCWIRLTREAVLNWMIPASCDTLLCEELSFWREEKEFSAREECCVGKFLSSLDGEE